MRSLVLGYALLLCSLAAACGDDDDDGGANAAAGSAGAAGASGAGGGGPGKSFTQQSTEDEIQEAFATAKEGDTLTFAEGTYKLHNTLVLASSKITVVGAGIDKTVLDFGEQQAGSEGLFAEKVGELRFEGFTVRDTKGNGLKVLSGQGVVFSKVKVEWTGAEPTLHGPYGIYPVSSKQVLIDECVATGASDSGIYVGQSDGVVVRHSEASGNVAGIEIENTFNADVYENNAHDNTAGILIFDLPGLPQKGGHNVRVYKNTMKTNNLANFAPKGNIVGIVPAGTGFFVMANHDVEIFDNTFDSNATVNSAIISYVVSRQEIKDPDYYPYPSRIYLHDNTYIGGGDNPDATREMGILLLTTKDMFDGKVVPDILYDGYPDPKKTSGMEICIKGNKDSTFADLHLDKFNFDGTPNLDKIYTTDPAPYDCTLPALPAVSFPGL